MVTYAKLIQRIKTMSKNKVPTAEEAKAKLEELKSEVVASAENKKARISPTQIFLGEIKEVIEKAIKDDVSYAQISRDIFSVYSFKISTQTLRAFAHNVLGISKRKKSASATAVASKDKVYISSEKTPPKKMANSDGIKTEKKGF